MSDVQKRVYRRMLQQPDIQILVNKDLRCSCGSPLPQVECCKKTEPNGIIWSYLHRDSPDGCPICPFCLVLPCLVKLQQISNHLELIKPNPKDEVEKQKKDAELAAAVFGADIDLVGGSAKSENFMGIVYAHHNEDVVNMGTKGGDEDETEETVHCSSEELKSRHEMKHTVKVKSSSLENRKVAKYDLLEQKRKEFSHIASFMGMDDLEFSKCLLAASPVQQSEVLQEYKRKRKRKCEHNQN